MDLAVDLLRSSFEPVNTRGHLFTHSFYDRLLARSPELRSIFESRHLGEQYGKLLTGVTMAVRNLEKPTFLEGYLAELGSHLLEIGLEPPHLEAAGECLVDALRELAEKPWSRETEEAWRHACKYAVDHMVRRTETVFASS